MEAKRKSAEMDLDGLHALVTEMAHEDFLSPEIAAVEYAYSERLGEKLLNQMES